MTLMSTTVAHFREECEAIAALMEGQSETVFARPTLFKQWTVGDIFKHLHLWNIAAHLSLTDPEGFTAFLTDAAPQLSKTGHQGFQRTYFAAQTDAQVYADWLAFLPRMYADFGASDPDTRVAWAGPPMSARSSLIARQMEHWAHTQAVYDLLGVERINTDRLEPIVELGIRTYSWSHRVRGLEPPRPKPHVALTAPSGALWTYNEAQADNRITGSAEGFAQTVTQCRNVADTDLVCVGEVAERWMATAQCFAGGAEVPPGVGERKNTSRKYESKTMA